MIIVTISSNHTFPKLWFCKKARYERQVPAAFPPARKKWRPFYTRLEDCESRNDRADGEISTPAGIPTPRSPVVQPTVITVYAAVLKSLELTVPTADSSMNLCLLGFAQLEGVWLSFIFYFVD